MITVYLFRQRGPTQIRADEEIQVRRIASAKDVINSSRFGGWFREGRKIYYRDKVREGA